MLAGDSAEKYIKDKDARIFVDEVLVKGDPKAMGKNVGDDLTEGKSTLPLIHTLQHGRAEERALVQRAISGKSAAELEDVVKAVRRCGALDYSRERARHYQGLARDGLNLLPPGASRDALQGITDLAVNRDR